MANLLKKLRFGSYAFILQAMHDTAYRSVESREIWVKIYIHGR